MRVRNSFLHSWFHLCALRLAGVVLSLVPIGLAPLAHASSAQLSVSFLGIPSTLNTGSTFSAPAGVAVDGLGDVFVVDRNTHQISEILAVNGVIPASPTIQTLSITNSLTTTAFQANATQSMGIDGSGNLFLSDSDGLWEIPANSGYTTAVQVSSNANYGGIAVDAGGNLFVVDEGSNAIVELTAPLYTATTVISGFSNPTAVAVDAIGDLFVCDSGSVEEFPFSNNAYGSPVAIDSLSVVDNMVIDASGDLIVPDTNNGVFEYPAFTAYASRVTLSSAFLKATAVAVAPNGTIILGHTTTLANVAGVYKL